MNTDTNELSEIKELAQVKKASDELEAKVRQFENEAAARAEGFEPVPEHLNRAARRAIERGHNPVAFNSGGKLSRWARQRRRGM